MGKAYANRKKKSERPEADFYRTPEILTEMFCDLNILDKDVLIYEPCCGDGAIVDILRSKGFSNIKSDDLRTTGKDFLEFDGVVPQIITNPAFSIFDETVLKCQEVCTDKFVMLAKVNFFGAYKRNESGVWKHLKQVYIFNRQVDYRSIKNEDRSFFVGNLITGWFVWDKSWNEDYWETRVLDVNDFAKGSYEKYLRGKSK